MGSGLYKEEQLAARNVKFPIYAECKMGVLGQPCHGTTGDQFKDVEGLVQFEQIDAQTCRIKYKFKNVPQGRHGFHVHEKADFSKGCNSAGEHYNPFWKMHGGPKDENRHVGDLGNIEADANKIAQGEMTDKLIKLYGKYNVLGRSMMVHDHEDDLGRGWHPATYVTGNAGGRIACGEIIQVTELTSSY